MNNRPPTQKEVEEWIKKYDELHPHDNVVKYNYEGTLITKSQLRERKISTWSGIFVGIPLGLLLSVIYDVFFIWFRIEVKVIVAFVLFFLFFSWSRKIAKGDLTVGGK